MKKIGISVMCNLFIQAGHRTSLMHSRVDTARTFLVSFWFFTGMCFFFRDPVCWKERADLNDISLDGWMNLQWYSLFFSFPSPSSLDESAVSIWRLESLLMLVRKRELNGQLERRNPGRVLKLSWKISFGVLSSSFFFYGERSSVVCFDCGHQLDNPPWSLGGRRENTWNIQERAQLFLLKDDPSLFSQKEMSLNRRKKRNILIRTRMYVQTNLFFNNRKTFSI